MEEVKPKSKKQIILEEAAKLFREKGYPAASMRELAVRVGLQPSSFYNHIESKEEMLWAICYANAEKFLEGMDAVEEEYEDPVQQIKALIGLHIRIATEDLTSVTVFNDEWKHLSELNLMQFLTMRKSYEHRFLSIIETGMEAGTFKRVHPTVALYTLLNALRWIYYWYKPEKGINTKVLQQDLERLLLGGLLA